jgi:hypothetical protein
LAVRPRLRQGEAVMVRIAITQAAFDAICATLPQLYGANL